MTLHEITDGASLPESKIENIDFEREILIEIFFW